jgi:hypothetical protein
MKRAVTTRTLAADVNTLEANSYFPESENKTVRKKQDMVRVTHGVTGLWDPFLGWERETIYLLG